MAYFSISSFYSHFHYKYDLPRNDPNSPFYNRLIAGTNVKPDAKMPTPRALSKATLQRRQKTVAAHLIKMLGQEIPRQNGNIHLGRKNPLLF